MASRSGSSSGGGSSSDAPAAATAPNLNRAGVHDALNCSLDSALGERLLTSFIRNPRGGVKALVPPLTLPPAPAPAAAAQLNLTPRGDPLLVLPPGAAEVRPRAPPPPITPRSTPLVVPGRTERRAARTGDGFVAKLT